MIKDMPNKFSEVTPEIKELAKNVSIRLMKSFLLNIM